MSSDAPLATENGEVAEPSPFAGAPDPAFEVLSASAVNRAAAPTMRFRLRVTDESGLGIFTIALTSLITVEPAKRTYDDATRERLIELFGAPERWATTTDNFRWAQIDSLVPAFTGSTECDLTIACTYDHEIAAAKYFEGLSDGEAPLRFHFNGTVYYEVDGGRLRMVQLPWDRSSRFGLPVEVWRETIDVHYPFRGWVPADKQTIARLERLKERRGLPTFDATLTDLLEEAESVDAEEGS